MKYCSRVFLIACAFLWALPVCADVLFRGFQIGHESMTDGDIAALATEHNTNIVRFQITHPNMDGITEAGGEQAYIDMVEGVLDAIDEKMDAVIASGQRVSLGFALPPGGFASRTEVPPHSKVFSNATFQTWYINMLVRIVERYATEIADGDFYAFDINQEPAHNTKKPSNGADDWNALLQRAITAIRVVNPTLPLMVKPLYADPSKLTKLPAIDDDYIVYGYHWYLFNAYQHTGVSTDPFSIARPTNAKMKAKMLKLLAKFYLKYNKRFKAGAVPTALPVMAVAEFAVSACATASAAFLNDLLALIERDDLEDASFTEGLSCAQKFKNKRAICLTKKKKAKKRCLAKARKAKKACNANNNGGGSSNKGKPWKKFKGDVEHESWTLHAYAEADIWDPRTTCSPSGDFTMSESTDRFDVLDSYFGRNASE